MYNSAFRVDIFVYHGDAIGQHVDLDRENPEANSVGPKGSSIASKLTSSAAATMYRGDSS